EVRFCSTCVVSNQRPNSTIEHKHGADTKKATILFDSANKCDACHAANDKNATDWDAREAELVELCDRFRRDDGHYDCLVPGSGGKDSFYTAHVLKHKYNMNPLTITWAPHIYTDWGWKNFQAWMHAGFDNFLFTPNGRVHRLLTRLAVEILFHPFQPFILGQKNLAPAMSIQYDIPFVVFGENEAEYGNPRGENANPMRDWSYFASASHDDLKISGLSLQELRDDFGLSDVDLHPYLPVDPEDIKRVGTEVHYLGYYHKWHLQGCYYYAKEHGGFEPSPERTAGTYSKYSSIDDKIDDFHFYTSFIKFGIGRATNDASQEIRAGDIERDEGVALVKRYDGEFPERFAKEIFEYLSIPESEFPVASKMFEQPLMDRAYFDRLTD
ncbi:MAG: N-acetyl sugar amidotransferase, partial [Pseudomonadota bacterium]|nr:N-acetyl sugar amidotransferase [Pseudomonadota bacterium]